MSLFDRRKECLPAGISTKSALALAAMTMVAADVEIDTVEIEVLKRMVRGDEKAFNQAYKVFKDKSCAECIEVVDQTLNEQQKRCVLVNLVDLAMADGILAGPEKQLLTAYIKAFRISEVVVKQTIEVIELKNNYSVFDH